MKIAYLTNQYPKVSHSFIRREIKALEDREFQILRIALRGWDDDLADGEDLSERDHTRYLLREGPLVLVLALLSTLITSPRQFLSALRLAARMAGTGAERPLPYHFAYLAEACRMLPWLKSFGAAHLHAHFGTNSAEIAMLAHVLGGPPYSFTIHGPDEFDKRGIGEKVQRAAFVATVSSYGRGILYRWTHRDCWAKVALIRTVLEPEFYDVAPVPVPPTPRLICVARLSEEKGQLLLIEAAAQLLARGVRFEIVLAGDGDMRQEIEARIAERALGNHVRLTGSISSDQVRSEILAARGLVLTSFHEGMPVVIVEAMALRRPVLATYVGGIPELVRPGENGWLVPAGSVDALARAMEDFLSRSDEELNRMGNAGYLRAVGQHSMGSEVDKLVQCFRRSVGAESAMKGMDRG